MRGALLPLALLAACGNGDQERIQLVLDVPAEDRDGSLLADLDSLELHVSDGQDVRASRLYRLEDGLPAELSLDDVPTGDGLLFHLTGFSMGAEVAYGRTCRLSIAEQDAPEEARLYFARVGRFREGAPPAVVARTGALMFTDDQGRAVVAGGSDETLVELFDPRVGLFEEGGEAVARIAGALAVRPDGTAILAGGLGQDETPVGRVEEITPRQVDAVRQLGPEQPDARRTGLALAALADRSVLLAGGRDPAGALTAAVSLLAAGDDQFRPVAELAAARAGHTASVALGGVVYLIGGLATGELGGELPTGTIELYRSQDQSVRPVAAALLVPRSGHSATVLADGRILLVGGLGAAAEDCGAPPCLEPVAEVEIFDPILGETRVVDEVPGGLHQHTATVIAGGRVLIAGGRDRTGAVRADTFLFDPDVEGLVPTRDLTHPRAQHTATELCDGTLLLVGGAGEAGGSPPPERYNPASRRQP